MRGIWIQFSCRNLFMIGEIFDSVDHSPLEHLEKAGEGCRNWIKIVMYSKTWYAVFETRKTYTQNARSRWHYTAETEFSFREYSQPSWNISSSRWLGVVFFK